MLTPELGRRYATTRLHRVVGGAAACPIAAYAQQGERLRRIGWLDPAPETDPGVQVRKAVIQQTLERMGWSIGRNLAIEYRWVSLTLSGLGAPARNSWVSRRT